MYVQKIWMIKNLTKQNGIYVNCLGLKLDYLSKEKAKICLDKNPVTLIKVCSNKFTFLLGVET